LTAGAAEELQRFVSPPAAYHVHGYGTEKSRCVEREGKRYVGIEQSGEGGSVKVDYEEKEWGRDERGKLGKLSGTVGPTKMTDCISLR